MSELTADFAVSMRRFERLESLVLSTETLEWEWTRGRQEYAALLVRVTDDGVRREIDRTLAALDGVPGVDPYPQEYWHATLKGLGFVVDEPSRPDEISQAKLKELAGEAKRILESAPAFEAVVGPPAGFAEVVIMEVHDGGAIRELNTRLAESLEVQRGMFDGATYLPHISIARYSSQEGIGELKSRLATLRSAASEGARMRVTEAELIVARLSSEAPVLDVVERFALR